MTVEIIDRIGFWVAGLMVLGFFLGMVVSAMRGD